MKKKIKFDILPALIKKSKQTNGKNTRIKYNIAAVAVNVRGEILGISRNTFRSFLSCRPGSGQHAEMRLINRYKSQIDTIYILRTGGSGNLLPIDPCSNCKKNADRYGIKIVSLSNPENQKN